MKEENVRTCGGLSAGCHPKLDKLWRHMGYIRVGKY